MRNLIINKYAFESDKVTKKYRFINLADYHRYLGMDKSFEENLISTIKEIKPDALLIAGDYNDKLNDIENLEFLKDTLENLDRLCSIAPTYQIYDWHDISYLDGKKEIARLDIFYDVLITSILERGIPVNMFFPGEDGDYSVTGDPFLNDEINIYGCSFPENIIGKNAYKNKEDFRMQLKMFRSQLFLNKYAYNIAMVHPASILFNRGKLASPKELGIEDIDLIVTGHNHKSMMPKVPDYFSQIIKEHVPGIISPEKRIFPPYYGGKYQNGDLNVAVSLAITPVPSTTPKIAKLANKIYHPYLDIYDVIPQKKQIWQSKN